MRIALVVSRYNDFVTARLEAGAREYLREAGVLDADVVTFWVPGAFELAQAAQRVAATRQWDGVVTLGCLIRGETPHFDYIAAAAAHGITPRDRRPGSRSHSAS
jgi:6,7-dimethyl-8-ribityllumazine synthase